MIYSVPRLNVCICEKGGSEIKKKNLVYLDEGVYF